MTYIKTDIPQPGIVELLFYKSSTGSALSNLAHTLLLGPSTLTSGERELIAAHVSRLNNCEFCHESHAAAATTHLGDNGKAIACLREDVETMPVSNKLKALLHIATRVQQSGRNVSPDIIENARKFGASDECIHDAILVAAAFCMYNRYVDGMNTMLPESKDEYIDMGKRMSKGYKYPPAIIRWFVKNVMRKNPVKLKPRSEKPFAE